ncbi:MAG: hypothetical protein IKR33_01425, partial [Bacteroidales bacterium]|nr:hypothetical protein [Bacteroidales bacterium]
VVEGRFVPWRHGEGVINNGDMKKYEKNRCKWPKYTELFVSLQCRRVDSMKAISAERQKVAAPLLR